MKRCFCVVSAVALGVTVVLLLVGSWLYMRSVRFSKLAKHHKSKWTEAGDTHKKLLFAEKLNKLEPELIIRNPNYQNNPSLDRITNIDYALFPVGPAEEGMGFLAPPGPSDASDEKIDKYMDKLSSCYKLLAEHHETLFKKYSYASSHPWLRVSDDPKPPAKPESP